MRPSVHCSSTALTIVNGHHASRPPAVVQPPQCTAGIATSNRGGGNHSSCSRMPNLLDMQTTRSEYQRQAYRPA